MLLLSNQYDLLKNDMCKEIKIDLNKLPLELDYDFLDDSDINPPQVIALSLSFKREQ